MWVAGGGGMVRAGLLMIMESSEDRLTHRTPLRWPVRSHEHRETCSMTKQGVSGG